MLVLRALVLLLYIHGAAAQTCALGQVAVSGTCTFYHMDPELIFWFKYNLDDRFSYNGGSLDSLKCFGNASAYRMPLTNTQGTISTFAKRGGYSIKSVMPTTFPPEGGMPAVVQTSLPLHWSNKAMTYTYWFQAQKVDNFFSMTFYDLTPTDGTVSMSWNDFNGDWMINWYDGSVTPNNGYTIFNYAMTTLSYKWTFFVIQLYEYDSSGKVAFDVYFNNTKIVTWNSNLILKTKFSIQVRTQSFFSSPSLQSANFPYSYVDKYGYIDDTRLYSKKLSSDYMAWLFNPCNSPLSLDEDSSLCRCPTGWVIQASSCVECGAGKIVDTVAQVCITCAAGTYSGGAGASACTSCPAGKSSSTVGASAASGCDIVLYATYARTISAAQQFYMANRPYVHYKATKYQFVNDYLQLLDIGSGQNRHSQTVNGLTRRYPDCFVPGMSTANANGGTASVPIIKFQQSPTAGAMPYLTTGVGTVTVYFTVCGIMRSLGSGQQFMGQNGVDLDVNLGYHSSVNEYSMVKVGDKKLDSNDYPAVSVYRGARTNWQVICVKNDWLQCPSVRINGLGSTYDCAANNPNNNYSPVANPGAYWLENPMEFNQLVSWNRLLTPAEFQLVSDTLVTYMSTGVDPFLCAENLGTTCGEDVWSCNAGYTGPNGGPCTGCPTGQYKGGNGSAACTSCPGGTFSGATGASVCTSCPAGTYSNALGASGAGACTRCPGGTASSVAGASSLGSCSTCGSGLYSFGGASSCVAVQNLSCSGCPANTYYAGAVCAACGADSVSVAGSAACECKAGFTGAAGACQACPAGTYKRAAGTAACRGCQANSVSASGSALCACAAGYTGNTGEVCVACVVGKYKGAPGSAACVSCASRRNSPAAAPNITSCICDATYTQVENASLTYEAVYAQACVACAPGTFKALTGVQACTTCAQNQSSVAAMTVCSCVPGFTGPDGGPCAECAIGTYKDWLGPQACTACPAYSNTAVTGMTLLVNCTCNIGYTGPDGGPCPACVGGKYKNVIGTSACIACNANFYSTLGIAATSCSACPAGYQSFPGTSTSADCCGFNSLPQYGQINLARSCGVSASDACTASALTSYPYGVNGHIVYGADKAINGEMDGGYIGAEWAQFNWWRVDFSRQVTIKYVRIYGSGWHPEWLNGFNIELSNDGSTFTYCATGQSPSLDYATGLVSDHACDGTARYLRISIWWSHFLQLPEVQVYGQEILCACNIGYTGASTGASKGQCTTCLVGTYKATNGSAACTLCVANTFHNITTATSNTSCLSCPAGTVSIAGESTCFCAAGSTGPNLGPCDLCAAGKYKNWRNASVCVVCPPNSDSVPGTSLCPCNVGYTGPLGGPCVACVAGKYKDSNGTANCTTCPASSYEPDLAATLVTNCTCNAGYDGADGGPCVACALGKYKATNGSASCAPCPADTYIDVQASAYCKACPQFTTSVNGSADVTACRCMPGYTGSGGGATVSVYSSNLGRSCGANSNQACLSSQSTTRAGQESSAALDANIETISHTETGGDQWFRIDFGKVVTVQSFTVVILRSHEVDFHRNIQVRVGGIDSYSSNPTCYVHSGSLTTLGVGTSYWTRDIACTTPREGQYLYYVNPSGTNYVTFAEFVAKGLLSMPGTSCFACGSGRYKPSIGASECTKCNVSTFSEAANATSVAACLACQGNSSSIVGSPSKMFCQCDVGFEHEGEECQQCTPGTYNTQLGRMACSNCTVGLYSVYYQAAANETCLPCPAEQWSPEGSSVCTVCPANSAALPARGRIVDCLCNVGYTGPGGGPCVQCEVGKYKNTTGAWACTTCPAFSWSALASVKVTNCSCNAGFTGPNGLPCTACSPGKYKAVSGAWACDGCAENTYADGAGFTACRACVSTSVSANGSASIYGCTCNAGYTGPTYLGVQYNANFARSCGDGGQACATAQSSDLTGFTADLAVDGTVFTRSNTMYASSQWWRVNFGRRVTVTSVLIFFSQHTTDALVVSVGDSATAGANGVCASATFYGTADDWKTLPCAAPTTGQYLHVRNTVGSVLGMREIQVLGSEMVTMVWPGYCVECLPGFFKAAVSNEPCTACAANTFSNASAARFAETCVRCAPNAVSANASVACDCDVGFTAEGGACVACALGKFKHEVGAAACTPCPTNSVFLANSSEGCLCAAGAQGAWS